MKYIINLGYGGHYYLGKDYRLSGLKYACETSEKNAKRYKTQAFAERALERITEECENTNKYYDKPFIEEIEE